MSRDFSRQCQGKSSSPLIRIDQDSPRHRAKNPVVLHPYLSATVCLFVHNMSLCVLSYLRSHLWKLRTIGGADLTMPAKLMKCFRGMSSLVSSKTLSRFMLFLFQPRSSERRLSCGCACRRWRYVKTSLLNKRLKECYAGTGNSFAAAVGRLRMAPNAIVGSKLCA